MNNTDHWTRTTMQILDHFIEQLKWLDQYILDADRRLGAENQLSWEEHDGRRSEY